MREYEVKAYEEVLEWKRKMLKRPKMVQRLTKQVQLKINEKIPDKAHEIITDAIKKFVKVTLAGSQLITKISQVENGTLEQRDKQLDEILSIYRKTAVVEGAGTGAAIGGA